MNTNDKNIFEPLKKCVICKSEKIDLFVRAEWDIWEKEFNQIGIKYKPPEWSYCKNCSHVFLNPRFSKEFEERLYGNESIYRNITTKGKSMHELMLSIDNTIDGKVKYHKTHFKNLKKITNLIGSKEKLNFLDFGAGWGSCSTAAQKIGLNYKGLEIDPWCLDQAKKLNRNVTKDFDDFENLDLLYSCQVFEHINDPRNVLEEFIYKMKIGSYIFTNVPTYEYALIKNWSMGGLDSLNWFHSQSYSGNSLLYLFELYGFEKVKIWLDNGDVNVLVKKKSNKKIMSKLQKTSLFKKQMEFKLHIYVLVNIFKFFSLPKAFLKFILKK